ncbi:MAG: hypothetical protein IKW74_07055 [Thermoguttaceae bacterium]|nr:hypothetical protein [Thermoguttaceae bacterium]
MTIRVICKNCNSKIDAKDELLNQVRRCPKCKNPLRIVPEPVPQEAESVKTVPVPPTAPTTPAEVRVPTDSDNGLAIPRIDTKNVYAVFSYDKLIAFWKKGEGWMLNVGTGFSSVKKNQSQIPDQGTFVLVEGNVHLTDQGPRLVGIRFHSLEGMNVLHTLIQNESDILRKKGIPTSLNGTQKRLFLQYIRQHYFIDFTENATDIIEFLTNYETESRSIGNWEPDNSP